MYNRYDECDCVPAPEEPLNAKMGDIQSLLKRTEELSLSINAFVNGRTPDPEKKEDRFDSLANWLDSIKELIAIVNNNLNNVVRRIEP